MGAADDIRAGKLQKYQALEEAGMNNHTVEMMLFFSGSGSSLHTGNQGNKTYKRLTLKPNPEVRFTRSEVPTDDGLVKSHDVILKGAFPEVLSGLEVMLDKTGAVSSSVATSKTYPGPREFRADIEKADYFLIDGEKFEFRGGGFLKVDAKETEWSLKLVRTAK